MAKGIEKCSPPDRVVEPRPIAKDFFSRREMRRFRQRFGDGFVALKVPRYLAAEATRVRLASSIAWYKEPCFVDIN